MVIDMDLENGLYIVRKKKGEVYDIFTRHVVEGRKGLWVSNANPIEL